jgi:hypothetical protein
VLAAESVASKNSVTASRGWVTALETEDVVPASVDESSAVL